MGDELLCESSICFGYTRPLLRYLQHFSPGRHPSIADFSASALGASFGGLAGASLARCLWNRAYPDVV
jgi:VanZ family protein